LRYAAKETQTKQGMSSTAAGMENRHTWMIVQSRTAQSSTMARNPKNVEWRPKKKKDHPMFTISWKIKRIKPN
jgi:hypothetical protein